MRRLDPLHDAEHTFTQGMLFAVAALVVKSDEPGFSVILSILALLTMLLAMLQKRAGRRMPPPSNDKHEGQS